MSSENEAHPETTTGVDASALKTGVVFRLLGKVASVRPLGEQAGDASAEVDCYLRGRLFDRGDTRWRNHLAVGDEVDFETLPDEPSKGIVSNIHPRRTVLVRQLSEKKQRLQLLAANVEQLIVVVAIRHPPLRVGLIERYLAIAHHAGIQPSVCVNKIDLVDQQELEKTKRTLDTYRELNLPIVYTSAAKDVGLADLRRLLKDRRSVLVGHSGVGKSRLARAIQPSVRLLSSELDRKGRGRHTTTASVLLPLDIGGELVDTPGIRELGIQHIPLRELAQCFPTMRDFLDGCRFNECTHVHEPDCSVKEAVSEQRIPRGRYASYVKLYEEIAAS